MDVVEHHNATILIGSVWIIDNVAKDDASLSGWNLDGSLDSQEWVGSQIVCCWSINKFKISKSGKFHGQVLQSFICLIDNEDIYHIK